MLEKAARQKNDEYLDVCQERQRSFVHRLVYLVDVMVYKKARAFEKRVTSVLASKWDQRYIEMGWRALSA